MDTCTELYHFARIPNVTQAFLHDNTDLSDTTLTETVLLLTASYKIVTSERICKNEMLIDVLLVWFKIADSH